MHVIEAKLIWSLPANDVAYTGRYVHEWTFLACGEVHKNVREKPKEGSPRVRPEATERARPTDLVKSVLPPRYP